MSDKKKTGLLAEFKEFINQGNVMDMAVGVIIGAALTAVVTALITYIIQPCIALITGGSEDSLGALAIQINENTVIDFGAFIAACINFIIIAFVVFLMVKAYNKSKDIGAQVKRDKDGNKIIEIGPTCPFCLEDVNVGATFCSHCGQELPEKAHMIEQVEE